MHGGGGTEPPSSRSAGAVDDAADVVSADRRARRGDAVGLLHLLDLVSRLHLGAGTARITLLLDGIMFTKMS
ncbi:MAG: hypothetical protein U0235_13670 [Polyangiaceae bacterium]